MNRSEAGKLGQSALKDNFDSDATYRKYMSEIGKRGAQAFHAKYEIIYVHQAPYGLLNKETGEWEIIKHDQK